MIFSDEVKKIIKEEMNEQGISLYRMAIDLNVSRGNLSRFFNGKEKLSLPKIDEIFKYLNLKSIKIEF